MESCDVMDANERLIVSINKDELQRGFSRKDKIPLAQIPEFLAPVTEYTALLRSVIEKDVMNIINHFKKLKDATTKKAIEYSEWMRDLKNAVASITQKLDELDSEVENKLQKFCPTRSGEAIAHR